MEAWLQWVCLIFLTVSIYSLTLDSNCLNVSTTPITAMGYRQWLPLSVVQLKGKHCWKPHCRNGVVDSFRHCDSVVNVLSQIYMYVERFSVVKLGRSAFLLRSANELNFFPSYNLKALVYTLCTALASYGLWTGCQRRQNFIYYTPVWTTVLSS